MISEAN